jgi:hypothetical protein
MGNDFHSTPPPCHNTQQSFVAQTLFVFVAVAWRQFISLITQQCNRRFVHLFLSQTCFTSWLSLVPPLPQQRWQSSAAPLQLNFRVDSQSNHQIDHFRHI